MNISIYSLFDDVWERAPAEHQNFLNSLQGMPANAAADLARRLEWSTSKRK